MLERHGVGPFLAERLNEPLGLVIGLWRVGPGADVLELEDGAGFGKGLGDVGRSVVAHHLTTLDAMTVEPGQCPNQETDRCALLLIGQHLDVGEPWGVVDGHVDPVVSDASRAALLPIVCDAVTNLAEAGQLLDVDVNQIAASLSFVALNRRFWIKVSQPDHLSDSGPATCKYSAGKSLLLRLVMPGGDGHSGARKSTAAGPSASDGHWRVYAWGVRTRLGGDTSTGSDLTPHWLLNNVVKQNS